MPQTPYAIASPRPHPNRVLVLGGTGMVGRSWIEYLRTLHIECHSVARPEFDLMEPQTIERCFDEHYDLVVNAAAWTDVDGAESDEDSATRANAHAVFEIAQQCHRQGATLLTYSTDYVFSGNANKPYPVDAPINPINAYGRSKALGESLLAQSRASHILIRTSWVYAPWGTNFVRTIRSLAQSRNKLHVVNDQRGRPTSAQHLAQSSLDLYLHGAQGIWHLTDNGQCTWFEFATALVKHAELECQVLPCNSDTYPRPAVRPSYSTLDITNSINLLGPLTSWAQHLGQVLDTISGDSSIT